MSSSSPSKVEWEEQKERLRKLYFDPNHGNLRTLSQTMLAEFGFRATRNQYLAKFSEWGFRKNLTVEESKKVIAKVNRRQREGKDTIIELFGQEFPRKKLKKIEQRFTLSELKTINQYEDAPTPPGLIVQTPPENMPNVVQDSLPANLVTRTFYPRPRVALFDIPTNGLPFPQFRSFFDSINLNTIFQANSSMVYPSMVLEAENEISAIYEADGDLASVIVPLRPVQVDALPRDFVTETLSARTTWDAHNSMEISESAGMPSLFRTLSAAVFERHPGDFRERLAVLDGPSDSAAFKEFLSLVVCITSNHGIHYGSVQAERLLEWIAERSRIDIQQLLDLSIPTVQASLEFFLLVAMKSRGRHYATGRALLQADTKRKLFLGRPDKLLEAAVILEDWERIGKLVAEEVHVNHFPHSPDYMLLQAISSKRVELVRFWLQHGASAKTPNHLRQAILSWEPKIVKAILANTSFDASPAGTLESIPVTEEDIQSAALDDFYPFFRVAKVKILQLLLGTESGKRAFLSRKFRSSLLISASLRGYLDVVKCLVEAGADVNQMGYLVEDKDYYLPSWTSQEDSYVCRYAGPLTCLFGAVWAGQVHVVQFLVSNKAEVNYRLPRKYPCTAIEAALLVANRNDSFKFRNGVVSMLLEAGAVYDASQMKILNGLKLTQAVMTKNLELAQTLIEKGASPDYILDACDQYNCCKTWRMDKPIELFLAVGGNITHRGPRTGNSVILLALRERDFTCAKSLINQGADVNILHRIGYEDWSLFELAVNHPPVFDPPCDDGTELVEEHLDFLRFLLKKGARTALPPIRCKYISAGLRRALENQHTAIELVRFLVEEGGADVNAGTPDHEPLTPLQYAILSQRHKRHDIIQHHGLIRYLLSVGANVDGWQISETDHGGASLRPSEYGTPLQMAVYSGEKDIDMELVKLLLDFGANVNTAAAQHPSYGGNYYFTALQGAARRGDIDAVHLLLQHGANVNAPRSPGHYSLTALESAAENGSLDTVQLLLYAGAQDLASAAECAEQEENFLIASILKAEIGKRTTDPQPRYDSGSQ